ncbi:hypothetical protein H0H92_009061 [Tricholoma furcatifolium]|nr:hypothetical protein H0H92_009061 [Tricholoma furcatifolium]
MADPSISEFIAHPDYQQVAAFFLGAVFITSLNYSSRWIQGYFYLFKTWISRKRSMPKDAENNIEKSSIAPSISSVQAAEYHNLIFTITLCFTFASLAFFGSLLSFSTSGGAACAFLVAWGGMAAQTARVIALLVLLLELKALGIAKIELYGSLLCLFVEMILVFVNNALGTGILRLAPNASPTLDPRVPSPIVRDQSAWFSSASGSSGSRPVDVAEEAPVSAPVAHTNIVHPFAAQYEGETSRFSATTMTSSQPGTIRVAQRVIISAPGEVQSPPVTLSPSPSDVRSVPSPEPRKSVEIQVLTPEVSPSVSPRSLLMHPWHERRRQSADVLDRISGVSAVRGGRMSYMYQGFTFPVPPIPSPSAAMRRYTSSTLASPMFSQEGGDGNGKVTLLTFQSAFRGGEGM